MSGRSSSAPADNGQLFDTSDEGVGAAAAAVPERTPPRTPVAPIDDDGRSTDDGRRRRSATASGAFSGRTAALVDDLTLPSAPRWSTAADPC